MRTILKNGTVVDVVGESLVQTTVVIEDDRIVSLGDTDIVGDDSVVELSPGSHILPGLANCHAHLGWDGHRDLRLQSELPDEVTGWTAGMNIHRALSAGVTTVRDLGMNGTGGLAQRAIRDGVAPYIRLLTNGRAIATTGGHTWWCCREADGVDDCRKAVREQAKAGAEWIKIMACHDRIQFTMPELRALVDEAHMGGLRVTAHATFDEAIRRVVEAGVDCVEHGGSMSDDTIKLMLERSTWLVTTFSPVVLQAERGLEWGMTEEAVAKRRREMAQPERYAGIRRAADAGVRVAFGTDAGSPVVPHNEIVPELSYMITAGVCADTWAALRAITVRAAELLQLDKQLGTVTAGKTADLVVVHGNPVTDLEALRTVERVYVRGRLAFREGGGYAQVC